MWLFSDFQYGFRSSQSTADLLTVVFDRIARAFSRSAATQAVALDISKAFNRVSPSGRLMVYQVRYLVLFLQFSVRQPWVVLDGKSSQDYPVNARVLQCSILGLTLLLLSLYINELPHHVICNIAIYTDDTGQ